MASKAQDTSSSPLGIAGPASALSKRPETASYLQLPGANGSSNSLPGSQRPSLQLSRDPLLRTKSQLGQPVAPLRAPVQQHKSETDRTDALWAEMQATLADVEISASRGTHFFGPAHAAALEELRQAQIALAQSWARGEGDNEIVENDLPKSEADSQKSPTSLSDAGKEGKQDEAEKDMIVAKRRKEANDRYFERVGRGVVDVVGRLEEVATAMVKVERESREVWSETDSLDSVSLTDQSAR